MTRLAFPLLAGAAGLAALLGTTVATAASDTLTGAAAFGDWRGDLPGLRRLIRPDDLPPPHATPSASNGATIVERPAGAMPHVPAGFSVSLFAAGLDEPRILRTAPNGDVFVAETASGTILVLRAKDGAAAAESKTVFARGLHGPFGIAFYPPGPTPRYVYVADTDAVLRFAYAPGDTEARADPEPVIGSLPRGGHWTRDVAFSPDGQTMYVSIGSGSNDAEGIPRIDRSDLAAIESERGLGAGWGPEEDRADVLAFDPEGGHKRSVANGLRNCAGLAVEPVSGTPWCAVNERDGLGDDLPPDYVTRVQQGAFYGWPWFYIGNHGDPNHTGERPDLAGSITVPDVLLQAHSAPLGLAFYSGTQFPEAYRGNAFVALHGSWNRSKRTGYKVARIVIENGKPTGEYEDFLTGFVKNDGAVWARPVGVAVAHDGALLVSEDANGTIWRIAYGK
jgi:glucose/arabinose dehydrogenase